GSSELKEISAILTLGNGLKRGIKSGGYLFEKHSHRNNPSGGRRFPLEVYIFANDIKELERGFYHYNIKKCGLEFIAGADDENQIQLLTNEESIGNSIFTVFMTAVGLRSIEKYGHLGYRLIFLEAGHLSQSFWLTATALGLRCWPMAGINESRFYKTLKINSHQEFFVFCLNFGR
ncbi:MAG: SagB/ThcOx family dehydrogenase, partial [Bdellovibrionales bacterium]|nr:SagB/ThcOx family dehydrogenase [Bdellovibrionales bacterium]